MRKRTSRAFSGTVQPRHCSSCTPAAAQQLQFQPGSSPGADAAPNAGWLAPKGLAAVVVAPKPPAGAHSNACKSGLEVAGQLGHAMPTKLTMLSPARHAAPQRLLPLQTRLTKCGLCGAKGLCCPKAWAAAGRAKRCRRGGRVQGGGMSAYGGQ